MPLLCTVPPVHAARSCSAPPGKRCPLVARPPRDCAPSPRLHLPPSHALLPYALPFVCVGCVQMLASLATTARLAAEVEHGGAQLLVHNGDISCKSLVCGARVAWRAFKRRPAGGPSVLAHGPGLPLPSSTTHRSSKVAVQSCPRCMPPASREHLPWCSRAMRRPPHCLPAALHLPSSLYRCTWLLQPVGPVRGNPAPVSCCPLFDCFVDV